MHKNTPLAVAGIIFSIVALGHLARLIYGFPIIVGTTVIPTWASLVGLIVALVLAIWMFVSLRGK